MRTFYERQIEGLDCRLFIVANSETATINIEQIPSQYMADKKANIVSCHLYKWDAERVKALSNAIYKGMVDKGFIEAITILKEKAKELFGDDYSITRKETDCFCIKPLAGKGIPFDGTDFHGFCTMDGLKVDDGNQTYCNTCPEEIKPIFRSLCTGEIKVKYPEDVKSFLATCKQIGCELKEDIEV